MSFDTTFISRIKIINQDLERLNINTDLSDIEKWESAFLVFETEEEETNKFISRYKKIGLTRMDKKIKIAELFCGKGNSLLALEKLGFNELVGVDISQNLLNQYKGEAKTILSDCLKLDKITDSSLDLVIIQGGAHHLDNLKTNLPILFSEIHRILKQNGEFILIEPWLTPFLKLVHFLSSFSISRRISKKITAFAVMVYYERSTYHYWLSNQNYIINTWKSFFDEIETTFQAGKAILKGAKK